MTVSKSSSSRSRSTSSTGHGRGAGDREPQRRQVVRGTVGVEDPLVSAGGPGSIVTRSACTVAMQRFIPRCRPSGSTMLPGPPTIFQTIINHPDFDDVRGCSSLRLAVTGAAVTVPVSRERMRAVNWGSRPSSPATGSPRRPASPPCAATTTTPRPSPRPRAGPSPTSRSRSSTTTATRCRRRAGRDRGPRLQRDARLLRGPRADRRGDRRRRLAAHRRHRRDGRRAATSRSPTA